MDNDIFKSRLNQALEMCNMRPVDLVNATGISKQKISQYVNGLFIPKAETLQLIAKVLNVNDSWLIGNDTTEVKINKQETLRHYLKSLGYEITYVYAKEENGKLVEVEYSPYDDSGKMQLSKNQRRLPKITKENKEIIITDEEYKKLESTLCYMVDYELNKLFKSNLEPPDTT